MTKRFTLIALCLAAAFLLVVIGQSHVYQGPIIEPSMWNPNVTPERVVKEGRKLIGIWYDPLQGYLNNIGGKLGLIVCMDVPVIAYRNSGSSILKLLEADFNKHPEHYGPKDGNSADPYFGRRARNLYSYCKHNNCLDMKGPPQPGDVVFMSRNQSGWISHIALVSSVDAQGYNVIEASREEWYVTREESRTKLMAHGYIFRGFGHLLKPITKS